MNEMVISAGALLEEQIPETLEGEPTAVDVTNVTEDAKAELQRLKRELESARELSLDPLARSEVVIKARQDSSDLEFTIQRLTVAIDRLKAKHAAAVAQEEEAKRAALHAEVVGERDALVSEVRERYPTLTGELADLFGRVRDNDKRTQALGLPRVEAVARNIPPHGYLANGSIVGWLVDSVRLPAFDPRKATMGDDFLAADCFFDDHLRNFARDGSPLCGARR